VSACPPSRGYAAVSHRLRCGSATAYAAVSQRLRCGQSALGSVLSSQCMMPSTLETAPLTRSNFSGMAGSTPGLKAA